MNRLSGKVAIITGGTRGIGLALAEAFAAEGAVLVVASRSYEMVERAVSRLSAKGYQVKGYPVDVSAMDQVQALADHAIQDFGRFDIWVNNAGIAGPYGPTMDMDPKTFLQVVQTNILGVYNGSLVAMRHFLSRRQGKLINLLGHGAKGPVPFQNAYSSSKAWVRSFTKSLVQETKESGVGVFAFSPGMVLTELLTDVEVIQGSEHRLKNFGAILRMWAKPPEAVTEKAVWLASSATDGQTGLEIYLQSTGMMLGGALREGIRSLLRRPAPSIDVKLKVIPPTN